MEVNALDVGRFLPCDDTCHATGGVVLSFGHHHWTGTYGAPLPARDSDSIHFYPDSCPRYGTRAHIWKAKSASAEIAPMPLKEWLWKLGVIYIAYLVLYYSAGYFIAWQNPEVRAFYGSPGEALPFFQQMAHIFTNDPWLTPYQLLRTLIWVAGALFIIRGSRLSLWQTALIVGLALSVPQNIGHILPNSLIPLNSVRMSHLVETASSTFVFGLIVTWLLYPKYLSKTS